MLLLNLAIIIIFKPIDKRILSQNFYLTHVSWSMASSSSDVSFFENVDLIIKEDYLTLTAQFLANHLMSISILVLVNIYTSPCPCSLWPWPSMISAFSCVFVRELNKQSWVYFLHEKIIRRTNGSRFGFAQIFFFW